MKLTRLDIQNTIGCRHFAADLKTPITLFAGANGAGKSSILQAVKYALTGEMPRISLKKDGEQLVTDGAKTGAISVEWADGGKAVVGLPACKLIEGNTGDINPAMPFLCDMHRFSSLADNDRRSFLFALTGTTTSAEDVKKRLIERKVDPAKIEVVLPLLRSGFPAAHKEAASQATQSKGAWKAVTGETYGSKKAEGWKAPTDNGTNALVAADLPGIKAEITKLNDDLTAENQALGAAQHAKTAAQSVIARINALREQAGSIGRITAKLGVDEAGLKEWADKVAATRAKADGTKAEACQCPECNAKLVWRNGELLPANVEKTADPEAVAKLPEHERAFKLMQSAVDNGKRDLAAAQAAAESMKELEAIPAAESDEEINARKVLINDIRTRITAKQEEQRIAETGLRFVAEAEKKTTDAAKHHADVEAWTLIADALAPDGIPGELLAQALKPINTALAQSANDTGWMQVTIDADMQIKAAGRPFQLLSASEKWRSDAMITAAIALLSGVKIALFDEFDVLDLPSRKQAVGWFGVMAEAGEIHSLLVAGTLKALPSLPSEFESFWIENGMMKEAPCLAAA